MALGWVALALLYLTALFWIGRWGDRGSSNAKKITSHPAVYSLALAIYCTAWTFFGAVGEASRNTWNYLPILLGPMLVYLLGFRFIHKLALVSKKQHITTVSDFIASRYGKRQTVALLVTIIALLATVPYIALQLKAIAATFQIVSEQENAQSILLIATVFMAIFSIYFGTKRTDVTEYRRGLMLAIAFESTLKLLALCVVAFLGYLWWQSPNDEPMLAPFTSSESLKTFWSFSFIAQTVMAAAAVICLPRQFHVAIVDNLSLSHLKTARWLFPLYLGLTALVIPIIAVAGKDLLAGQGHEPDTYVLHLAILSESLFVQILVFVGGLSAATAMIIVATLTLSTMITNDIVLPKFLAHRGSELRAGNYTRTILTTRRVVIGLLLALAYLYHQQMTSSSSLAAIGLIAFSLVIQLLPAIVGGLYWKRGHAHGVYAGLLSGLVTWVLWLLLPAMGNSGQLDLQTNTISQGAMISLVANIAAYALFSITAPVRLIDKIQAQSFVAPKETRLSSPKDPGAGTTVGDLITLLSTFLGESRCRYLIEEFGARTTGKLVDSAVPREDFLLFCERALGGVLGASSAKALLDSALSGKKMDFEEVVNFFDDTTQALQYNMSALLTSLESIDQGISVVDKNLNLVAWNKRYLSMFNYPEDLIDVGTPIEKLVRYNAEQGECGLGDVDLLVHKRLEHLRNGSPHRFVRQRSDGKMIEMVGNPLPGGGFVTSFNDITAHIEIQKALEEANIDLENRIQKRTKEVQAINQELRTEIARRAEAEEELIAARQAAEKANASKTRFLALASHDILQPLNAAKLYLSALEEMSLPDNVGEILHRLDDSVGSSEALIATLLDISRLDQGDLQPTKEPQSIRRILTPLVDEFTMKAKDKGLSFTAELCEDWVETDRTFLHRIVQNLLSNAVKYTRVGGIVLTAKKRRQQIMLEVRDTGIGIPGEEQSKIFTDFYRVEGSDEHGVGLGLSVVTRLSKQLGAPIGVASTPGKGSCFSITLPVCAAVEQGASPSSVRQRGFNDLSVLCIDDQQENLDALQMLLHKWHVNVSLASNRNDAFSALEASTPEILLVDYHLNKDLNGIDLITEIRQHLNDDIPAALVTANQDEGIVDLCREHNISYLSKPLKPAKLRALLQSMQHTAQRQAVG